MANDTEKTVSESPLDFSGISALTITFLYKGNPVLLRLPSGKEEEVTRALFSFISLNWGLVGILLDKSAWHPLSGDPLKEAVSKALSREEKQPTLFDDAERGELR